MKRSKYISILLIMILIINIVINNIVPVKAGNFNITVTQNTDEYGSVNINWSSYNYKDKNFKVYKSVDGGVTYETVGIDYTSVKEVRCLQIYPISNASNQFKQWMETNGYGKGIIRVNSVYIDDFNNNPDSYLKDSNGEWKYDVVLFGTWDSNNGKALSNAGAESINKFIKAGKGCIMGHDTNGSIKKIDSYGDVFNMKYHTNYKDIVQDGDTRIKIMQKGLITNYPWNLGDIGTILQIPHSHSGWELPQGTIWLKYINHRTQNNENYYLETYNNTAHIQTGHSNGAATADEQKILANLIFYMNQLLFNECDLKDSSAQDLTDPEITKINGMPNKIQIEATDKGNTYKYYVESYTKDDTTTSGLLDKSEIKEVTVTTGVKGYRYLYSNKKSETITNNGTYITNNEIPINRTYKYIHVAPIDGAGNIGNTVSYEVSDYLITTNASIGGVISNSHNIFKSESTSVFVAPMKGYEISNVVVDGVSVGKVETYNFINVTANHTITATFNKTSNWISHLNDINNKYEWINIKVS